MTEVIHELPLSESEKKLLINLYSQPGQINELKQYENDKYVGYRDLNDLLYRKIPHDNNKLAYLFTLNVTSTFHV